MPKKDVALISKWQQMVKDIPPIETLEEAGNNRHRSECFKIALYLTHGRIPYTVEEFNQFMNEYIRQLLGPEIYDVYTNYEGNKDDVGKVFRNIRKFTLGA